MNRNEQFAIIEKAEQNILRWSEAEGIHIYRMEFVVPFVDTDFSLGTWFFYATDQDVKNNDKNGTSSRIGQQFLQELRTLGYPSQLIEQVKFTYDSDENVQENFEGNYLNRLL